jgi:sulfur relay protein TusB/DsrH
MVLHTLSAPPRSAAFGDCLATAGAGDTIVLLGDGAYAVLPGSDALTRLLQHPARVCVLAVDAEALGVTALPTTIEGIDMPGLVALTEACPRQLAWY